MSGTWHLAPVAVLATLEPWHLPHKGLVWSVYLRLAKPVPVPNFTDGVAVEYNKSVKFESFALSCAVAPIDQELINANLGLRSTY
jgi:hypothetical protein